MKLTTRQIAQAAMTATEREDRQRQADARKTAANAARQAWEAEQAQRQADDDLARAKLAAARWGLVWDDSL